MRATFATHKEFRPDLRCLPSQFRSASLPPLHSPRGHKRRFVFRFSVRLPATFLRPLAPRSLRASSLLWTL